ncbi:MAG: purine-nucleoside phosphorylase, partial [Actinomycetota bacterium]|nr:purine-nucleoside phosphorylase [Actinomycetota bacterium]
MVGPIHLAPSAPLADRVLLPGDPGRALLLAQQLIEQPRMFNHNRGLWGYTGVAHDGASLTVQSTGMGGPSAAIVIWELAELGARRLLRVGTCGALDPTLELGELVVASEALAVDGASRALGAGERVQSSPGLLAALAEAARGAARTGPVASTDLFYGGASDVQRRWLEDGAIAVDMEAATLFVLAARLGLEAGAVLVVSDLLEPERVRIAPETLRESERRMG